MLVFESIDYNTFDPPLLESCVRDAAKAAGLSNASVARAAVAFHQGSVIANISFRAREPFGTLVFIHQRSSFIANDALLRSCAVERINSRVPPVYVHRAALVLAGARLCVTAP